MAQEGLKYVKDPYDEARYHKMLELAAADYSAMLDLNVTGLLEKFRTELDIITPKVGSDAAVVNDKDQLLVLKRKDDQLWCLPCGWTDVGESPAQAAVRETFEETGLIVEPLYYIGMIHKGPHLGERFRYQVAPTTFMKPISLSLHIQLSHEHVDYRWIDADSTVDWHPGHERLARIVFDFLNSDRTHYIEIN